MMNKTRECPACAVEVDRDADECPICGYEFPKQPLSVRIAAWVFIGLLLLWLIL